MRRRAVVVALTLGLLALAAGAGGSAESAASPALNRPSASSPQLWQDGQFGWTVTVPQGFVVTEMEEEGRIFTRLVVVSSFELGPGRLYERLQPFPADGVAFALDFSSGGPPRIPDPGPETRFPLDLADFQPDGAFEGDPPTLSRPVEANGWQFQAHAWIGAEAGPAFREALGDLIASLRFPSLEPGTLSDSGFVVLQPADTYAPQSVTRFDADDFPLGDWRGSLNGFFLVNAPGGFYALAWPGGLFGGPNGFSDCDVTYAIRAFACSDGRARWDIVGRVLKNPDPRRLRDDPLGFKIVKTSHDGKVMVSLSVTEYPAEHHLRRYWPAGSWQGPVPPRRGRILMRDQATEPTPGTHFHFTLHGVSRVDFGGSDGLAQGRGTLLFADHYPPGTYRLKIVFSGQDGRLTGCAATVKLHSGETAVVGGRHGALGPIAPCSVGYRS